MLSKIINKFRDNYLYLNYNKNRYQQILNKIKNKNYINIIFLTNHIAQWKYQSLFNLFNKFKKYKTNVIFIPDDNYSNNYQSEYNFNKSEFKKSTIDLVSSYDNYNN